MTPRRQYRELRNASGLKELLCAPSQTHCRNCNAKIIWGQLTPRKWVMIDQTGKIHESCSKIRKRRK